jgi:hypothetical protein
MAMLPTRRRLGQQVLLWTPAADSCLLFHQGYRCQRSLDPAGKGRWSTGWGGEEFDLLSASSE